MAALSSTVITFMIIFIANNIHAQFQCQGVGFYPHPSDCTQFYRCTDIWSTGQFQQYMFTCAQGTVFDASISVCNWPALVPGCGGEAPSPTPAPTPAPTTTPEPAVTEASTATPAETTPETSEVTYRPATGSIFDCESPGIVSDENNCNKFWLCKENPDESGILESLLYRCPEGYLFSSSTLRCKKEDDVTCVEGVETRNINTIQLTEEMLDSFFNKWSTF